MGGGLVGGLVGRGCLGEGWMVAGWMKIGSTEGRSGGRGLEEEGGKER